MMELSSVVIFMALVCGAGAWLASLLQDRARGPIGLGRSWLLGCAALSVALHVPLAVDGKITHWSFGLAAAACLGASILFIRDWWKRRSGTHWGGWLADLPWAGRLAAGAIILAAASHALRTELTGYDARSVFALKARILYDTGDVAGEDFRDVQRVNFNPSYPLLLPLIEAETYWCQGSYEHPGLRLLFVGFVLAIVSVHAAEIRRFAPANMAAFQALLLLLTPMMIDCGEGAGLSGSADLPLAAFVFAGTLDLFRYCRQPTWRRALSTGLLFAAALMTKQEGQLWIVVGAITALGLLAAGRFGPILPAMRHAIPGAAVLCAAFGLQVLVHRGMPVSPYYPSYAAALTDVHWLAQLADRPAVVVLFALRALLRASPFSLLWPCILGSLILLRRDAVPLETKCWRAMVAMIAAIYLMILVVTPLHLDYQLKTTFARLALHLFPLAMLIMAEQIIASRFLGRLLDQRPQHDEPLRLRPRRDLAQRPSAAALLLAIVSPKPNWIGWRLAAKKAHLQNAPSHGPD
jgi:hypothetical protein